eukprot:CAMPEP_0174230432 /NCGR_PEP_ID=MMETSP0417-20130205/1199_1 /TAXON_ID=242541 /ORGANISM="Mayorella sp, Strain BSH-02190019" /LENGTH=558 /DNA_ID=CAMNT_0015308127 /DNA_START=125 /DNA_END=1801 /DNA_ORIENTATION=-
MAESAALWCRAIALLLLLAVSMTTVATTTSSSTTPSPRLLGGISIPKPAFAATLGDDLFVTSFSGVPGEAGKVYVVPRIKDQLRANAYNLSALHAEVAVDGLLWPNEITVVPSPSAASAPRTALDSGFLVGDGFLPPGKNNGSVVYVNTTGTTLPYPTAHISPFGATPYFYHLCAFVDMNQDGWADVLTARATKPLGRQATGQLVWFEHPVPVTGEPLRFPWREHLIKDGGPDIQFLVAPPAKATERTTSSSSSSSSSSVSASSSPPSSVSSSVSSSSSSSSVASSSSVEFVPTAPVRVVAAEFFAERLTEYTLGAHGELLAERLIDDGIGRVYDVEFAATAYEIAALWRQQQQDGGGSVPLPPLLVTNYQHRSPGALFSYAPADAEQQQTKNKKKENKEQEEEGAGWKNRTTIYSGFSNRQAMVGSGAPGFVRTWTPSNRPASVSNNSNDNSNDNNDNSNDNNDNNDNPLQVVVCGDGAEAVYYFAARDTRPTGEISARTTTLDPAAAWQLTATQQWHATVGYSLPVQLGSTSSENQLLVSVYEKDLLAVYGFAPLT